MQKNNATVEQEEDVDLDHLRRMLNDIIYWFSAHKDQMRKTRSTLLQLIDEFSNEELRRLENERAARKRKVKVSQK